MSKQLTISDRTKSIAFATFVATALAGPVHVGTSMTNASPANAFGWSDIKRGAKKLGKSIKGAGKLAGGTMKDAAKTVGKGVKRGAKEVGGFGYDMSKGIVTTTRDAAFAGMTDAAWAVTKPIVKQVEKRTGNYDKNGVFNEYEFNKRMRESKRDLQAFSRNYIDAPLGRLKDKAVDAAKGALATGGTLTSRNPPRESAGSHLTKSRKGRRVRGRIVKGGDRALPRARSRSPASIDPRRRTRRQDAPGTVSTKLGTTQKPGEWGGNRPTTSKLPPPRKATSKRPPPRRQRPRPLTANDIKPPFCNSKFQNCSGKHKYKHNGKKYNGHDRSTQGRPVGGKKLKPGAGRDRSVWGRPVGVKKTRKKNRSITRTMKLKRSMTKRAKERSSFRKAKRGKDRAQPRRFQRKTSVKSRSVRRNVHRARSKRTVLKRRVVRHRANNRNNRKARRVANRRQR